MAITYRADLTRPLNTTEIDNNFRHFTGSHAVTGSLTASQGFVGSLTGTASYATIAVTSSVATGSFTFVQSFHPLPTAVNGALILSSSGDLYFGKSSAWRLVNIT